MATKSYDKSYSEHLSFNDSDLKTPRHDEIMMWLDDHCEMVVNALIWNHWHSITVISNHDRQNLNGISQFKYGMEPFPECPPARVVHKEWEYPVLKKTYHGDQPVGFIDFMVKAEMPRLVINIDQCIWRIECDEVPPLLFEVKTNIPSAGDLLRQIKFYQSFRKGTYVVVSEDDRFKEVLFRNGIKFFRPSDDFDLYAGKPPEDWNSYLREGRVIKPSFLPPPTPKREPEKAYNEPFPLPSTPKRGLKIEDLIPLDMI